MAKDKNGNLTPEEIIVLHKETFLACMQAMGIYLSNTFDYLAKVESSNLSEETKSTLTEILKSDLQTIGNISQALEQSMDYKIETNFKNEYIN